MQRIQTLYLLAATALLAIFFISPLAIFSTTDGIFSLSVLGIKDFEGQIAINAPHLIIISTLAVLLPFVNIFLHKKRMLQMRLCVVQIVLALGMLAVAGVYYYLSYRTFNIAESGSVSIRIVTALPLVAMVFDYLALRGIFKDMMLLKSLDRIR